MLYLNCSECNNEVNQEDIYRCEECGTELCLSCFINGEGICDECFEESLVCED